MAEKVFNIKFAGAEIISFMIAQPNQKLTDSMQYNFNFLVEIKIDEKTKGVAAITDININEIGNDRVLSHIKSICVFEFPDFDNTFTKAESGKYDTPIELEIFIKSMGLSTTRGMMVAELRGTYLHQAVLPLIDMAKLVKAQHEGKSENKSISN
jgi:hypothetical protein